VISYYILFIYQDKTYEKLNRSRSKRVAAEAFMFFASKNIKPQLTGPVWQEAKIFRNAIID
jgi:hypothetical protein